MKYTTLLEALGALLFVFGQVILTVAAAKVDDALAYAVGGLFIIFDGLLVTYFASVLDRAPKSRSERQ